MNVLVAVLALRRRRFEVDIAQLSLKIRRFVAVDAGGCAMRTQQRKCCLRVVEAGDILPRFRGVASLAPRRGAVRPDLQHALLELPFVRIGVATRAIQLAPVVDHGRLWLELGRLLVTVQAGHRNVAARQHESGLLVPGQRECRGLVSLKIMATIAGVKVRRGCELSGVLVAVTVRTAVELDFEKSVLPLRRVALCAFEAGMSALQGIRAQGVFLHREGGRLPSFDRMTGGALASVRALGELPVVRIGLVAIHALREDKRLLEVSTGMALGTVDRNVLALERELRLEVIEALVHRLHRDLLPSARVVARLAGLAAKAAAVRIFVAVGALVERNANILRLAIGSIDMTLGALHLGVQSGQQIARLRVVELGDVDTLPVFEVVTLLTSRPQASFVQIFVTASACSRQTEIRTTEVLDLDRRPFSRGDMRRIMTFVARQAGVLAFERIASFVMVEGLDVPLDEGEVFSVVLGVAARAFLAGAGRDVIGGVQPAMGSKPGRNFRVTVETLQRRLPAKLVAAGAVR